MSLLFAAEFGMMLSVMGCSISKAQVKQVIVDAKSGFGAWKKMSDDENTAKCQMRVVISLHL